MARLWGRSPRGQRACGAVPCGHWTRLTVLGALGTGGMVAAMAVEVATGGAVFHLLSRGMELLYGFRRGVQNICASLVMPKFDVAEFAHKAVEVLRRGTCTSKVVLYDFANDE